MTLDTFNVFIGAGTLAIALFTVVLVIFRIVMGKKSHIMDMVYKNALVIGFIIGFSAILGSLIYSEAYALTPCLFCWWQRIFLYPQVIIFAIALYRHGRSSDAGYDIFYYATPLALIGSLISLYHVFLQQGVIASTGACVQNGVSCTTIDISVFGFLTIPMMALILGIALSLLGLLVITNKKTA